MSDLIEHVLTIVRVNDGVITQVPGYWPVPVGATVELGMPNRDFVVEKVSVRFYNNSSPAKIDLYLDCVPIPTSLNT
jgi:hypothetical protein